MASPLVPRNQALLVGAPPMMPLDDVIQLFRGSGMHAKELVSLRGRMLTGAGPEHVPSQSLPSHAPQPSLQHFPGLPAHEHELELGTLLDTPHVCYGSLS